jgi:hypothetical protein
LTFIAGHAGPFGCSLSFKIRRVGVVKTEHVRKSEGTLQFRSLETGEVVSILDVPVSILGILVLDILVALLKSGRFARSRIAVGYWKSEVVVSTRILDCRLVDGVFGLRIGLFAWRVGLERE